MDLLAVRPDRQINAVLLLVLQGDHGEAAGPARLVHLLGSAAAGDHCADAASGARNQFGHQCRHDLNLRKVTVNIREKNPADNELVEKITSRAD